MNKDTIRGKWNQVKGQIKQKWGKLTDNDLVRIEGNLDEAAGRLQERYGMARDQAEREWKEFLSRIEAETTQGSGTGREESQEGGV